MAALTRMNQSLLAFGMDLTPWVAGRGKRGGVRVIYYFHDEAMPLFLLNVFAKNEKANLTKAEQNEIRSLLPRLVAGYRKRMSQ